MEETMEEKQPAKTPKQDFDAATQKAIDELVKLFKEPHRPLVEKVTDHYYVIG